MPVLVRACSKGYNVDLKSGGIAAIDGRGAIAFVSRYCRRILCFCNCGNDANYRVLLERIRENLDYMITISSSAGNWWCSWQQIYAEYGQNYRAEIEDFFEELAREYALLFEPFIYQPLSRF